MKELIPQEIIEKKIFLVRGQRVMLDNDLAHIYGVTTTRLNQQVKRNLDRFPKDFMFQLTKKEFESLMLQFATSNKGRGGRRKPPYVFTEHGAIMLASVLNTAIAVRASIQVVRAFVRLREILSTHKKLAYKLSELERKIEKHDEEIHSIFEAIRQLMAPVAERSKPRIGFHQD